MRKLTNTPSEVLTATRPLSRYSAWALITVPIPASAASEASDLPPAPTATTLNQRFMWVDFSYVYAASVVFPARAYPSVPSRSVLLRSDQYTSYSTAFSTGSHVMTVASSVTAASTPVGAAGADADVSCTVTLASTLAADSIPVALTAFTVYV